MYTRVEIFVNNLDSQYRHELLYSLSMINLFFYPKILEFLVINLKNFYKVLKFIF